jgi:hypothetical protein
MCVGRQALVERSTRMSVMLVVAAALFTFFDVQTTLASCGDYVTVGGGVRGGYGDASHSKPGVPVCKGPNCQRSMPVPVLPTKGLLHHSDAACCLTHQEPAPASRSGEVVEPSLLLAEGHSLPLVRPPCR